MPKKLTVPAYRLHKASGQAVVVLGGRSVYLGKWNTPESQAEYRRVTAEWLAHGTTRLPGSAPGAASPAPEAHGDLRVSEMLLAFWEHAKKHYRHPDGRPTGELDNLRDAVRPLRRLYGHTHAAVFGPNALRAVRTDMIRANLSRKTINARINRIRRVFRWAASHELLPVAVVQALATVEPLQKGRCDARESPGVRPVSWQDVDATLPHLPPAIAAMVAVMRYSNCRAEDVVGMRQCDLRCDGPVWEYRPATHKNQWREEHSAVHRRIVHLGARCQAVLQPFLQREPQAFLFSPRETAEAYRAQHAAQRKTRRPPSQQRRARKQCPKRAPRDNYSVNTFQQTIRKTCLRIGVPVWTVLQVRHARATEVRELYGLEGAAASLGDTVEAAQIYAERNRGLAQRIAREIG